MENEAAMGGRDRRKEISKERGEWERKAKR